MDITPQFASTTKSDAQGNWSMDSATSISPGFHQVLIRDQNGNESLSPLYIAEGEKVFVVEQKTETQWLDRVQAVIPPAFAYAILGLIFLLVLATLFVVWAGRRGSKRLAIILVILILTAAAAGAVFLNARVGVPSLLTPNSIPSAEQVDVRGSVVTPFGSQPVTGVDLTLGDTSIRTAGSGQFAFPSAHVGETIRLNHPLLKRAIAWRIVQGGTLSIPFDPALYNALNASIEAARGPISDQQLVITGAHVDDASKTVKLDVVLGSSISETFQLVGDKWQFKP